MRDKLEGLVVAGIARYIVMTRGTGKNVNEAKVIADYLYDAGYRKTSDVTKDIFKDIDHMLLMMFEEYVSLGCRDYSAVIEIIYRKLRVLEKKYTEDK